MMSLTDQTPHAPAVSHAVSGEAVDSLQDRQLSVFQNACRVHGIVLSSNVTCPGAGCTA
jgi:hypothetical protein